jgi:hypothetical protein
MIFNDYAQILIRTRNNKPGRFFYERLHSGQRPDQTSIEIRALPWVYSGPFTLINKLPRKLAP